MDPIRCNKWCDRYVGGFGTIPSWCVREDENGIPQAFEVQYGAACVLRAQGEQLSLLTESAER